MHRVSPPASPRALETDLNLPPDYLDIKNLSITACELFSIPIFRTKDLKREILSIEEIAAENPVSVLQDDSFWLAYFYYHFCIDNVQKRSIKSLVDVTRYHDNVSKFAPDYLIPVYKIKIREKYPGGRIPAAAQDDMEATVNLFRDEKRQFFQLENPPVDPRDPLLFLRGNNTLVRFKSWKETCLYLAHFEAEENEEEFHTQKFFFGILNIDKGSPNIYKLKCNGFVANGLLNCLAQLNTQSEYVEKILYKNTNGFIIGKKGYGTGVLMELIIESNNIDKLLVILKEHKGYFNWPELELLHIMKLIYKYNRMEILELFLTKRVETENFTEFLPTFEYNVFLAMMKDMEPLLKEPPRMRKLIEDRQAALRAGADDED